MSGNYTSQVINYINKLQIQYYTTPYDELVALGFLGRVKLYDWHLELIGIGIIVIIGVLFSLGAGKNKSKVDSWINAVKPVLDENFYQVGVNRNGKLILKDSPQLFTSYATGRVNISGLTTSFSLIGRQNYIFYLIESFVSSFFESVKTPSDEVEVVIKPGVDSKIGNYIFAIVNKDGMNKAREENYYLSLTKTSESTVLPIEFVFMSESTELNQSLINDEFLAVLSKSGSILKYLAITDLPEVKPDTEAEATSSPKLILKLKLKTDKKSLQVAKELVEELIKLTDVASKFQLKTEQQKKINNVRQSEINKIQKAIQERKNEELKEQKLEADKVARRNLEKLSPEAQEKLDKKQREKRERRAKNKQTKRL